MHLIMPSVFAGMIEQVFETGFYDLVKTTTSTSADLQRQLLLRLDPHLLRVCSDYTCFVCLRRKPQFRVPCGHCLCENCMHVFGRPNADDPWTFEVDSCFFCGVATSGMDVKVLPKTAGVRVITFDGGGVRGLATLQYLKLLQQRVVSQCQFKSILTWHTVQAQVGQFLEAFITSQAK